MQATSLQPVLRCAVVLTASLIFMSTAQGASKYKVLHYFGDRPAKYPIGELVADSAGNLYGTTLFSSQDKCGLLGCGVAFKLTLESGGTWKYSVIHHFKGSDGANPKGRMIIDSSGNQYGTTLSGGTLGRGTVFELSPTGGGWTETVLYSFGASNDLFTPVAGVIFDTSGNLYGTAQQGGNCCGGVFELKPSHNGWQETVIYSFGSSGPGSPNSNLVWDAAGNLYGTTLVGVKYGTVFELTPSSSGWTETTLHDFTGGTDGEGPYSGVVFDASGNLYGTTLRGGGLGSCTDYCGTVYQLTPSMGGWTETVLHAFDGSDGGSPFSGVIFDSAGNLYGTTSESLAGSKNLGVVFRLSRSGNNWDENVLHVFHGRDGQSPEAGLIIDQQGVLYGTAHFGGTGCNGGGCGVVFSLGRDLFPGTFNGQSALPEQACRRRLS